MDNNQTPSCWSHKFNQKPLCSMCRQPLQECDCISTNQASDRAFENTQSTSNPLFGKYKCLICRKSIFDCKCKTNISDDDENSSSSEPKLISPKCSKCSEPFQECKCNEDDVSSWNKKPKYICGDCNRPIEECICNEIDCESDESGEDLNSICESIQANLNECFGKCTACTQISSSANKRVLTTNRFSRRPETFPKIPEVGEDILKIDELDYNDSSQLRSKSKCAECNKPLPLCICKSQSYNNSIQNDDYAYNKPIKHKCKTCYEPVQDYNYRKEPVCPKSSQAKCIGCRKPLKDCICKPIIFEDNSLNYKSSVYTKYKCFECKQPIPDCTCDTDSPRKESIYQKSSVARSRDFNEPQKECSCKPNIQEDNSVCTKLCINCYQTIQDCTCDSNNVVQDFTCKKSQLSSIKMFQQSSTINSKMGERISVRETTCCSFTSNNQPTKPKYKCLRCKTPIQDCKCTSIGFERISSNDAVDSSYKSTITSEPNDVECTCENCDQLIEDCTCKASVRRNNQSSPKCPNTQAYSKPAFTKYKCTSCNMPLLECKCSLSDIPSVVLENPKPASNKNIPSISKENVSDDSLENTESKIYVCSDCNRPIQNCTCSNKRGFSRFNNSARFKCSECYKPLEECKCQSENNESVSELEYENSNEPMQQNESKSKRLEIKPIFICCNCKRPIEDCICRSNKPQIKKYKCSDCRQPIQNCKCEQDTEDVSYNPNSGLPKCLTCNNSARSSVRSTNPSNVGNENSRLKTKYIRCCKCEQPVDECICNSNDFSINQSSGPKRPPNKLCSKYNKMNNSTYNRSHATPKCQTSSEIHYKMTDISHQPRINKTEKYRNRNERSIARESSEASRPSKLYPHESNGKKKTIKNGKPKDFSQFPHPSLVTEPCFDECDHKNEPDCPLGNEYSAINMDSSKYTTKKVEALRSLKPVTSSKGEFPDYPPLFLKVCPAPKVGPRCSAIRMKKFPSKQRNYTAPKTSPRKSLSRRSPLSCTRNIHDNLYKEKENNGPLSQRKSCKGCNQPIPENRSVGNSVTNKIRHYNSLFQNNKDCKFN